MNKLLKLALITMLVLSLTVVITGCGKKEETKPETNTAENTAQENKNPENEPTDAPSENTGKSKTYNIFSSIKGDYVIDLEGSEDMGEGEEFISMKLAVKGEKICADVTAEGQHMTVLYKDNATYVIAHDEKAYMVQEGKDDATFDEMTLFTEEDLEKIESAEYKTGKEKIDNKEYEYEEFVDDETGTTERFYFSGNELKYIKDIDASGSENLLKVNTISSNVDDSLFDIPADYERIEY